MKTRFIIFVVVGSLWMVGCKRDPHPGFPLPEVKGGEPVAPATALALTPAVERQVQEKGQAVVAQAFGVLSSRLGQAIADAGLTNAIGFCSVHGLPLTAAVGVTNDVVLRRVTHRPRNPQNRANAQELAVISDFEGAMNEGRTPGAVVLTNKQEVFSFYSPIVLGLPLCLNCHGQPGTDINSATLEQLRRTYPADEAIGFKMGQLRGLWSVDFKRSDFVE